MPTRGIRTRSNSRDGTGSTFRAHSIAAVSAARSVLAPFVLSRVLTAIVALAAISLFPSPTTCPDVCHPSTNPLLDAATRWDAKAYVDIAHDGYGAVPANNAYFPLYPLLMRLLATLLGGGDDGYLLP